MRILSALLCLTGIASAQGYRSGVIGGTTSGSWTLPNAAPYTGLSQWSQEMRLHGFSVSNGQTIEYSNFGSTYWRLIDGDSTAGIKATFAVVDWAGGGGTTHTIDAPATDVVLRFSRNYQGTGKNAFEVWKADGSSCTYSSVTSDTNPVNTRADGGTVAFFGGSPAFAGNVSYIRISSTAPKPCTARPSNTASGDLLRIELEGAGSDGSPAGHTVTWSNLTFTNSPVVPILPGTYYAGMRAGTATQMGVGGNAADAYLWQQLDGPTLPDGSPARLVFSSRTAENPSITCPMASYGHLAAGVKDYTVRLRVTNAAGSAQSADFHIGCVAASPYDVVRVQNLKLAYMLRPALRAGSAYNPWPTVDTGYWRRTDVVSKYGKFGSEVGAAMFDAPPLTGKTCTFTNGSSNVSCSGALDLTTAFTAGTDELLVYWDSPTFGAGTGRKRAQFSAVTANGFTLTSAWDRATSSNVGIQAIKPTSPSGCSGTMGVIAYECWNQLNQSVNYYDYAQGAYPECFRTGLSKLCDYASAIAEYHWRSWYIDQGQAWRGVNGEGLPPRFAGLFGIGIKALLEGDSSPKWSYMQDYVDANYNNYVEDQIVGPEGNITWAREGGYMLQFALNLSYIHPDAATRAAWLPRIENGLNNWLAKYQCKATNTTGLYPCTAPEGAWRTVDYGPGWDRAIAEQPWHSGGFLVTAALNYSYLASVDPVSYPSGAVARDVVVRWSRHMQNDNLNSAGGSLSAPLFKNSIGFGGRTCNVSYYLFLGSSWGVDTGYWNTATGLGNGESPDCPNEITALRETRIQNAELVTALAGAYEISGDSRDLDIAQRAYGAMWGVEGVGPYADGVGADWYEPRLIVNGMKTINQTLQNSARVPYSLGLTSSQRSTAAVNRTIYRGFALPSGATQARYTVVYGDGSTAQTTCASAPCAITVDISMGDALIKTEYLSGGGSVVARDQGQPVALR